MRVFNKLIIAAAMLSMSVIGVDATTFDQSNQPTIYANIPVCNSARDMSQAAITDGPTTPTYGQTVTGGGGTGHVVLVCNGTATTPAWMVYAGGTGGTVVIPPSGSMAPPTGYTIANLITDETFSSSSLDTNRWNPNVGTAQFGRWSDNGNLQSPYSSASNCNTGVNGCGPSALGGNNALNQSMEDPFPYGFATNTTGSHLVLTTNNISFVMTKDGYWNGGGSGKTLGYNWISSGISSYNKTANGAPMIMPATGGYVQWRAKMPDARYGAWGMLWMMPQSNPAGGNGSREIDVHESGIGSCSTGASACNTQMISHSHSSLGDPGVTFNTGVDMTTDYHIYGVEYIPGSTIKFYFDGTLTGTLSGSVFNGSYEVITNMAMSSTSQTWRSLPDGVHNGPFQMDVNNIQVYRLPGT